MTFTKKQNDDLCVAAGIAGKLRCAKCESCDCQWCLGCSHPETTFTVYPDLLTAEGFLILWSALVGREYRVRLSQGKFSVTAFVGRVGRSHENKNNFRTLPEALFYSAAKVLEVPGV